MEPPLRLPVQQARRVEVERDGGLGGGDAVVGAQVRDALGDRLVRPAGSDTAMLWNAVTPHRSAARSPTLLAWS